MTLSGENNNHKTMVDPEAPVVVQQPQVESVPSPSIIGSGNAAKRPASSSSTKKLSSSTRSTRTKKPGSAKKSSLSKRSRSSKSHQEHSKVMKYGSLGLLVAQTVGLVLFMRYSRTKGVKRAADGSLEPYVASTAVFVVEIFKLLLCTIVVFFQSGSSFPNLARALHDHVWMAPFEVLKLCVPSLLYAIQNNLLYFALSNLDAATYQVCYQLKILTTAVFSAVLLRRHFSALKWFSLVLLTIGVAIVQVLGTSEGSGSGGSGSGGGDSGEKLLKAAADAAPQLHQSRILGLFSVLCAACTSGFSGVYFERILKGSQTSLWLRNIQMGLPSVFISYAMVYAKDGDVVRSRGFLTGYTNVVWTVVTIQAAGGLLIAVVVKYADNVLKVFATSFSIIVSCILSAFLFDFRPNFWFCFGAMCVMTSTVLYARPEPRRRVKSVLPMTATQKSG